ncbi:PH domain-containing protein [Mycobacterium sp.]|uniref:PH domain-containing protein n=1 Tax=Mycobacterium sp. TaxID=1785 RepID=UPI0025F2E1A1|nr:PH domain-containing protein [Mycobacterium sp.]
MQQTQWAPSAAGTAACGLVGIVMATTCVTVVTDAPGRLLLGISAAGLILFAAGTWRARPKLAITDDGLRVGGWIRAQQLRRSDIKLIRITEFRRIGRKTRLLEMDAHDGRLFVFSRWDLGTDPIDVLDALTARGYAG